MQLYLLLKQFCCTCENNKNPSETTITIAGRLTEVSAFLPETSHSLLPVPLARDVQREVGEDATETEEGEEDEDGYHDDDVVTDAGADVEPATVVLHQEEEMLKEVQTDAFSTGSHEGCKFCIKFTYRTCTMLYPTELPEKCIQHYTGEKASTARAS